MENYREVEGNLITMALEGCFDVIAQGNNCFCTQGAGIAPQMVEAFGTDRFEMELLEEEIWDEEEQKWKLHKTDNRGNINKLGQIDWQIKYLWFKHPMLKEGKHSIAMNHMSVGQENVQKIIVINSYTQYLPAPWLKPLDYEALTLCMRKINYIFKGKHIGLPQIGAGLAGGDWERIKQIIKEELKDCKITVVIYKPN